MLATEQKAETRPRFEIAGRSTYPITTWLGEALRQILLFPALHLFVNLKVDGTDNLTCGGPYVFAANHASHLDTPLLLKALPLHLRLQTQVAAAADYFFTNRWSAEVTRILLNAFPFERKGIGCLASIAQAQQLLATGHSILIFPEGTRTKDGRLQPFKRGVGKLAQTGSATVIPTWIEGTFAALPKGSYWPRRHEIAIRFGSPLSFAPNSNPLHIATAIEQQVRTLGKKGQSYVS